MHGCTHANPTTRHPPRGVGCLERLGVKFFVKHVICAVFDIILEEIAVVIVMIV